MVHGWGGAYVGDTPAVILDDGTVIPGVSRISSLHQLIGYYSITVSPTH